MINDHGTPHLTIRLSLSLRVCIPVKSNRWSPDENVRQAISRNGAIAYRIPGLGKY